MFLAEPIKQRFIQEDQVLILTGATWDDYEAMSSPEYDHYLISYLKGQITIMSPGRNHERIAQIIGVLIFAYCEKYNIPCFLFGSTRLKEEGKEGKEPDNGYAFFTDKDNPDLAIEVNFTSGSINDLTKYKYLKVPEVWIWQNNEIKFYTLDGDEYTEISESLNLKNIVSSTLIPYINRGFSGDAVAIKKDFLKSL